MENCPDVVGLKLAEASDILDGFQIDYIVTETISRKREPVQGVLRVIRQTESNGRLNLTVCRVPDLCGQGANDDDQ